MLRRLAAFSVVASLLATFTFFSLSSAQAAEVSGVWNARSMDGAVIMVDALPDGRRITLANWNDTLAITNPKTFVRTTAYTKDGYKLWVVDERYIPNKGVNTVVLNKDAQRFSVGTIMQSCFKYISSVGSSTRCVKSRV